MYSNCTKQSVDERMGYRRDCKRSQQMEEAKLERPGGLGQVVTLDLRQLLLEGEKATKLLISKYSHARNVH